MRDNVRRLERNANPLIRADRRQTWRWILQPDLALTNCTRFAFFPRYIQRHFPREEIRFASTVKNDGDTNVEGLINDNRSPRLKLSLFRTGYICNGTVKFSFYYYYYYCFFFSSLFYLSTGNEKCPARVTVLNHERERMHDTIVRNDRRRRNETEKYDKRTKQKRDRIEREIKRRPKILTRILTSCTKGSYIPAFKPRRMGEGNGMRFRV